MARPLRIEFLGAVYHITTRGDRKERIFEDGGDKNAFLEILASTIERYNWKCHGYCLMNNHYHLLIETPDGNLSKGMRQLNGVYTQWFNKKHNKIGHLFQGRFKAILVEKESYLLELCRYIVLNPVRAKLIDYPWEWKWTSYLASSGRGRKPKFLTTEWILSQFNVNLEKAQKAYEDFVMSGIGKEAPWKDLKGRIILGKDSFVGKIQSLFNEKEEIKEIPKIERYAIRPKLSEIFSGVKNKEERDRNIHNAHIMNGYSLKEIAEHLGIHYTTASKIIKKLQK